MHELYSIRIGSLLNISHKMHKNALNAWLNHHCLKFGWFNVFWNTAFFTALLNKHDTTWRLDKHANSLIVCYSKFKHWCFVGWKTSFFTLGHHRRRWELFHASGCPSVRPSIRPSVRPERHYHSLLFKDFIYSLKIGGMHNAMKQSTI